MDLKNRISLNEHVDKCKNKMNVKHLDLWERYSICDRYIMAKVCILQRTFLGESQNNSIAAAIPVTEYVTESNPTCCDDFATVLKLFLL